MLFSSRNIEKLAIPLIVPPRTTGMGYFLDVVWVVLALCVSLGWAHWRARTEQANKLGISICPGLGLALRFGRFDIMAGY